MTSKKAGRPPGTTYKEDDVALAMMADAKLKNPELTTTAAAREVCQMPRWKHRGSSDEAVIERLVAKWRVRGTAEMAAAVKRKAIASAVPHPGSRSMARLARSMPHGPPMFEFGRGQSHVVAAAAAYNAAFTGGILEPATAVDIRLLDALRNPTTARATPYNVLVDEIRRITGADIVGTSREEAMRLIVEMKRRAGRRPARATQFGF
jgi:hypothetical protein